MTTAILASIGLLSLALIGAQSKVTTVFTPAIYEGPLDNPMMGFAPNADYYEVVGENRLVYVDVTWRELEPEKGRYDFAGIDGENYLNEWKVKGKNVVFRFVCDMPGETRHMDIPDWLYAETGDGDWYNTDYGIGYSPNYSNPTFIAAHRRAVEALGKRYGQDDFFCYIELGSLGHWGEWHTKHEDGIRRLPVETIRDQYIEPYLAFFPNALLLMRRPFKPAAAHGMGLFNDVAGEPESTAEWLEWINKGGNYDQTDEAGALVPMPEFWTEAPVGGELTSRVDVRALLQDNLAQTVRLIRQTHMTFLGPYCPVNEASGSQFAEGIRALKSSLGYRLRVSRAELRQSLLDSSRLDATLVWVNDGSAPFYRNWEAVLILLDSSNREALRAHIDIDISTVIYSREVSTQTFLDTSGLPAGQYKLALAVLDPETGFPALSFGMEGMRPDNLCVLGEWRK